MPHLCPPQRSSLLAGLLCLLAVLPSAAAHGAKLTIHISSPSHGQELRETSLFFDDVNQELLVSGSFSGVEPTDASLYMVRVNGHPVYPIFNNGVGTFTVPIPAPTSLSVDSRRLLLPVVAAISDYQTGEVLAIDRILLYDARKDVLLSSQHTGQIQRSLAAQLTATAIDELQPVHLSSLPVGGLDAFNAELAAAVQGFSAQIDGEPFPTDGALCLPADAFTSTDAYSDAFAAATAQKVAYDAAKYVVDHPLGVPLPVLAAAGLFTLNACVQDWPTAQDFVACVDVISTETTGLEIGAVDSVDLEVDWLNPGNLDVETTIQQVDAAVEGNLSGVTIVWGAFPHRCNLNAPARPTATVADALLTSDPVLADWATCTDLEVRADGAYTDFLSYELGYRAAEPEWVELVRLDAPDFTLDNPTPDAGSQTCGDPAVATEFEALLVLHQDSAKAALDDVWEETSLQHTGALEMLLSRLELGTYEPADHRLDLHFETLTSYENIDSSTAIEEGVTAFWNSEAEARAPLFDGSPVFLYSPERDELRWAQFERDHWGNDMEASFTVTTGALNQVIGALSMTDRLWMDVVPTWQDLGIQPGSHGLKETDPVPMTGDVLGDYLPEFSVFGSTPVRILVRPTLNPFLWMHPDPPPIGTGQPPPPLGGARLTYQLGQLEVEIVEDVPGGSTRTWFSGWFDLYDETFQLTLDGQPGGLFLEAAYSSKKQTALIAHHVEIPGCHLGIPNVVNTCAEAIDALVRPVIQQALLSFVSDYPAPQFWDAAGTASSTKHLQQSSRWQWDQKVTFFARLPN